MTFHGVQGARVDIHSHILPQVDDGARSMDEALTMLRMAFADGTRTIVATPHAAQLTPENILAGVGRLRAAATGIGITILAGSEVKFSASLADDYLAGKLVTIEDSGYLLVEFPFSQQWTSLIHTALYALQLTGAMPVVAHAERYPAVQRDPTVLVDLAKMGIPIQINAGSLLGEEGVRSRQTAELLLHAGLAHVLASDGHRLDKRKPVLGDALDYVVQIAGESQARQMQHNAQRIIAGHSLNTPDPDVSALCPPSKLRDLLNRIRGS